MRYLPGYFEHIRSKTYIDKYPRTIIDINLLIKRRMIEYGPGAGNDILWLIKHGMNPENIFSLEPDSEAKWIQACSLYPKLHLIHRFHHIFESVETTTTPENHGFDFVYANNVLHCLEGIEAIFRALRRAHSHLRQDRGVFFGRTLSHEVDEDRMAEVEILLKKESRFLYERNKRPEYIEVYSGSISPEGISSERVVHRRGDPEYYLELLGFDDFRQIENPEYERLYFALATARALHDGTLVGIPPEELEEMARSVGFKKTYTEIREHAWKPTTDYYFRLEKED